MKTSLPSKLPESAASRRRSLEGRCVSPRRRLRMASISDALAYTNSFPKRTRCPACFLSSSNCSSEIARPPMVAFQSKVRSEARLMSPLPPL